MTLITPSIRAELTALYTSPSRHYHNLTHITTLLSFLTTHRHHLSDPDAVEAAIWFHDAIYEPQHKKPGYSESKSAELAVSRLSGTVEPRRLEWIRKAILATARHEEEPGEFEGAEAEDVKVFLDMDLSILAAEEGEFEGYERGVREEYGSAVTGGASLKPKWYRTTFSCLAEVLGSTPIWCARFWDFQWESTWIPSYCLSHG
ncbi:hypothetical protein VTJ49DRAFT_1038 [Mycothermus thermophilus]|uniref:HD domain-containing protein n=1 Tax=Humicola insolens TaxID=85995 RepID=A0ABR3VDF4_HUMIN